MNPQANQQTKAFSASKNFLRSPERFRVQRKALVVDGLMRRVVFVGGLGIVLSILGIFAFVVLQVLPLFKGASIERQAQRQLTQETGRPVFVGADEWMQRPFLMRRSGELVVYSLDDQQEPEVFVAPGFEDGDGDVKEVVAAAYDEERRIFLLAYGDRSGRFGRVEFEPDFSGEERVIEPTVVWEEPHVLEFLLPGERLVDVGVATTEDAGLAVFHVERRRPQQGSKTASSRVVLVRYERRAESLFDEGSWRVAAAKNLRSIDGVPQQLLVHREADRALVVTSAGRVVVFDGQGKALQTLAPFEGNQIALVGFVYGDNSLNCLSEEAGEHVVYSLFAHAELGNERRYAKTKAFKKPFRTTREAADAATKMLHAKSLRNKAFFLGSGTTLSLRYATTEKVLLETNLRLNAPMGALLVGEKYDRFLLLDEANTMYVYGLDNPHPEASWATFFEPIWYEDAPKPAFVWQSSAATQDYEPKLSMMPLLWGSLKGTLFALFFSVPLGLLAAFYVSEFLHAPLRRIVKPVMEIMASLPSVILGFVGALYLAPLVGDRTLSLCLMLVGVPLGFMGVVVGMSFLPKGRFQAVFYRGLHLVVLGAVVVVLAVVFWNLGGLLDPLLFGGGENFRGWWSGRGWAYEERNAFIVGFTMAFCVIPIIFTIAEDSFSGVPNSLRSAALALGSSPWQAAFYVVLPAAAGGVFSAVMIGFGRAVGETMIVLMATGNTPLMDFNPFTGMRTLAANIAVELPEAPKNGTLYRSLFLGALFLFVITFTVNTVAEVVREKLRKKYKAIAA